MAVWTISVVADLLPVSTGVVPLEVAEADTEETSPAVMAPDAGPVGCM